MTHLAIEVSLSFDLPIILARVVLEFDTDPVALREVSLPNILYGTLPIIYQFNHLPNLEVRKIPHPVSLILAVMIMTVQSCPAVVMNES